MRVQEEKLLSSHYFIWANDFERHRLWKENKKKTNWEDDPSGVYVTIGHLKHKGKKHSIIVSFSFAKIYGKQICFFHVASRFIDNLRIEKYILDNYLFGKNDVRSRIMDSNNFHNAIIGCKKTVNESEIMNWKTVILTMPNEPYYDGKRIMGVLTENEGLVVNGVLFDKGQFRIIDENPINSFFEKNG
jgi:hypothetical protein